MKASQLRDLARKYAAGGMTREAYIAERTRMIDGIVSGEIELRYRSLEHDHRTSSPIQARRWYTIGGITLLVTLLLLALFAHFSDDANEDLSRTTVVAPPDPGAELLHAFVTGTNWSNDSLLQLETDWQKLTPFEQENARRSPWFRRLKQETTQRIVEQEALLAAGEMDALLVAGRLREFAGQLGFENE